MKKIFCLLLLIIFISSLTAYAGERPKEFRGLVWGTHISKVDGLVLQEETVPANLPRDVLEKIKKTMRKREERGEKTYVRPSDSLKVAGGEVKVIEYVFVKDQSAEVIMRFGDYGQYLKFKGLFNDLYGAPDKEEKGSSVIMHDWYAENDNEANVTLFYSDSYRIKAGSVLMKCKAFLKKDTGL